MCWYCYKQGSPLKLKLPSNSERSPHPRLAWRRSDVSGLWLNSNSVESPLLHTRDYFKKSLMQGPNQWERLLLGSDMEFFPTLQLLSVFCPFKTRKHFLTDMLYNLSEKRGKLNTKAIPIQESKCNWGGRNGHRVCANKGTIHLEEPRHNFCSSNSVYLCTSLICNVTRYYAVVSGGNGSANGKLKILQVKNAY